MSSSVADPTSNEATHPASTPPTPPIHPAIAALTRILSFDTAYEILLPPVVYEGWLYASNGVMAIREPAPADLPVGDSSRAVAAPPGTEGTWSARDKARALKTVVAAFTSHFHRETCTDPLPPWSGEVEPRTCHVCNGRKRLPVQCTACKGSGEHYCEQCESDHECGRCNGEGVRYVGARCQRCEGTGSVGYRVQMRIGSHNFDGERLRIVEGLGGVKGVKYDPRDTDMLRFVAEGGREGMLMSLRS